MAKTYVQSDLAQVGDWVEAHGVAGGTPRRGQIVELLGTGDHARYRVRWDEMHESIVYPADGVMIISGRRAASRPGAE